MLFALVETTRSRRCLHNLTSVLSFRLPTMVLTSVNIRITGVRRKPCRARFGRDEYFDYGAGDRDACRSLRGRSRKCKAPRRVRRASPVRHLPWLHFAMSPWRVPALRTGFRGELSVGSSIGSCPPCTASHDAVHLTALSSLLRACGSGTSSDIASRGGRCRFASGAPACGSARNSELKRQPDRQAFVRESIPGRSRRSTFSQRALQFGVKRYCVPYRCVGYSFAAVLTKVKTKRPNPNQVLSAFHALRSNRRIARPRPNRARRDRAVVDAIDVLRLA